MPATATQYDVMLFSFDGVDTARRVLHRLRDDHRLDTCEIEGEAFITHDADGHVHFEEKGGAALGATFGAVTAGVVGLVGGPVVLLLMVVAGGIAGGIAGHYAGRVLPAEDLHQLGDALPTGSSAYVALVDAEHAASVADIFLEEGATVIDRPVEADLSSAVRRALLRARGR